MEEICRDLLQTEKSMLADGTYFLKGRDPLTEVLGGEHGGRTRGISSSLGVRITLNWVHENRQTRDQVHDMEAFKEEIKNELRGEIKDEIKAELRAEMRGDTRGTQDIRQTTLMQPGLEPPLHGMSSLGPDFRGSSCASGGSYDGFDDIEEATECDLLWPHSDSNFQVASGMVHPTRDGIIHGSSMSRGYLRVQVDTVETEYLRIPVPKANGEVKFLEDAIHSFIQWPRDKVRIKHTMSPRRCISRSPRRSPMELQTQMNDLSSGSCYRPQMEQDPMTLFQNQMPPGGYMSLLGSQMPLDSQIDYVPTRLPPTIEKSMASHPQMSQRSTSSLAPPEMVLKHKSSDKEIKGCLAKLKKMPKKWKDSAKRFKILRNKRNVRIVSPPGMYVKQWTEDAGYQDILDLHINTRISVTIIHWWSMCLYQRAESRGGNKCAFLNANVTFMCTKNADLVIRHIRETRNTHPEKQIYVAPYWKSDKQWFLFLVCPNLKRGYIVDSSRYEEKSENDYCLTPILESSFGTSFEWTMVKCRQQKKEWESGYYLLQYMYELVITKQADFPQNLWNDVRHITQSDIFDIAYLTSSEFYKSVVIPLANEDPDDADDATQ